SDVSSAGICYDPVADPTDPDGPLTAKAFGAAIQLNRGTNQPGTTPEQPKALIAAMARWGFGWAGRDAYPQGALFRYRALSVARGSRDRSATQPSTAATATTPTAPAR